MSMQLLGSFLRTNSSPSSVLSSRHRNFHAHVEFPNPEMAALLIPTEFLFLCQHGVVRAAADINKPKRCWCALT